MKQMIFWSIDFSYIRLTYLRFQQAFHWIYALQNIEGKQRDEHLECSVDGKRN